MTDPFMLNSLIIVGAYVIGSIPFSILVTRLLKGTDVRTHGSGHAGATNTMRVAGWFPGIMVMILDIGKGALVAWLAMRYGAGSAIAWIATGLVVVGHCWPIFAGFQGGMGLATAGGALLVGLLETLIIRFGQVGINLPFLAEPFEPSPTLVPAASIILMVIVLLVLPAGLFGRSER